MRRSSVFVAAQAVALLAAVGVEAAPKQRKSVDQKGDFVTFGNTLGQDCEGSIPTPTVGTVSGCGANTADTSPDVFWRSDDTTAVANGTITPAMARSTAVLKLPAGATVTYARLYWSAAQAAAPDTTALLERVGTDAFSAPITADGPPVTVTSAPHTYYQSSADVTALIQQHGPGSYRVGDVGSFDFRGVDDNRVYAAWTIVVFYQLATDPLRNLTLFDGLDIVEQGAGKNLVTVPLSGFLVPNAAGFDAKLAVLAYEGDDSILGDSLAFNGTRLSNALNPVMNFFNNTRSDSAGAVTSVGDLPQLTGAARSTSGLDLDVVNVTSLLTMGAKTASIQAETQTDFFILGAFITSISTIKPDFTTTDKTFTNETHTTGGAQPGDVLKYTITSTNNGNDPGVSVVLTDVLPAGVTFVPGSIEVTAGANMGTKSDVAGDDQGEYVAATRTVTVRLGTGANMTSGGSVPVGTTTTVTFKVKINPDATGVISNQAIINAAGQSGAPTTPYSSDGNGPLPGTPPTDVVIDSCQKDSDCPAGKFCFNTTHPYVCADCRTNADCTSPTKPVCDATSHTCRGCTMDSECSGTTPLCETTGKCVQCKTSADCSGLTPLCVAATSTCGPCTADGPAGGCIDPARPACNTVAPLAGACTECSSTNATKCTFPKPQCQTLVGLCGCDDRDGDKECGGNLSGIICNGHVGICTPGCSEAPMRNRCPIPQVCSAVGGPVGSCVVPSCISDLDCRQPRPKCDTVAVPRACVGCLADTDCGGGYVCDSAASKTCVECTATQTASCTATNAGTRCLVNNTCGCATDSECGSNISGRVCNTDVTKCTYGCRGTGGNGCPPGLICTSKDNSIGACVTPGAADAGVDAGPDASPDSAPDMAVAMDMAADLAADQAQPMDLAPDQSLDRFVAADTAPPAPFPDAADFSGDEAGTSVRGYVAGGGCKCNAGGRQTSSASWLALVLPVALLMRRRRRG